VAREHAHRVVFGGVRQRGELELARDHVEELRRRENPVPVFSAWYVWTRVGFPRGSARVRDECGITRAVALHLAFEAHPSLDGLHEARAIDLFRQLGHVDFCARDAARRILAVGVA
jgi:hypothetical protein